MNKKVVTREDKIINIATSREQEVKKEILKGTLAGGFSRVLNGIDKALGVLHSLIIKLDTWSISLASLMARFIMLWMLLAVVLSTLLGSYITVIFGVAGIFIYVKYILPLIDKYLGVDKMREEARLRQEAGKII